MQYDQNVAKPMVFNQFYVMHLHVSSQEYGGYYYHAHNFINI